MSEPVILEAIRTPFARRDGAFRQTRPDRGGNVGASDRTGEFEAFAVGQGYAEGRLTPGYRVTKDFVTHR